MESCSNDRNKKEKGKERKKIAVSLVEKLGWMEERMLKDQGQSRRRAIIVGAAAVAAGLLLIAVVISNMNTVHQHVVRSLLI